MKIGLVVFWVEMVVLSERRELIGKKRHEAWVGTEAEVGVGIGTGTEIEIEIGREAVWFGIEIEMEGVWLGPETKMGIEKLGEIVVETEKIESSTAKGVGFETLVTEELLCHLKPANAQNGKIESEAFEMTKREKMVERKRMTGHGWSEGLREWKVLQCQVDGEYEGGKMVLGQDGECIYQENND